MTEIPHDITLPWTHDSGAYRLSSRMYSDSLSSNLPKELADAFSIFKSLFADLPVVNEFEALVKSICLTQPHGFDEQLNNGVRGFDLRVVPINGQLNTGHGMVGEPIVYILQKVRQFLEQTHREIVVLSLGIGSSTNDAEKKKLVDTVRSVFADRIAPVVDLRSTTIGDITKGMSRVIVLGPGFRSSADLGFDGNWWVNTDDEQRLIDECVARINAHQSPGVWVNPSWTLTPQLDPLLEQAKAIAIDILRHRLDKHRVSDNVKKLVEILGKIGDCSIVNLSRKVNPQLQSVVDTQLAASRINAISVDFYSESSVVDIAVARSMRTL